MVGGGEPRNGWGHGQMGGLIPTSTPARLATSLPVHPATHPSVHPAASLLVPEPQGALDGLREAERSAASSAGGWRGSTTQTGDRQALQPLQEKWGFLKRCWRGFENSVQFGAAETLGFPAAPPKGGGARESVQLRASRWRRPPEGGSFAPNMRSLPGEPVASLQSPASRPLGSLGPPPGTLTPSSAQAPPTKKAALRVMRSPGHALTCAALETWPGRRGDAQTQTPSHWPARLRFRGPPSRGRGGAAGASQRACASRVSRINWTQRKGQRNEKEIKRRFTTTVKNLQSGAGMEFHATEPAPTGPRGQAGPFLPAPRESRPPSRPALSP